jgi:hypothetical protein
MRRDESTLDYTASPFGNGKAISPSFQCSQTPLRPSHPPCNHRLNTMTFGSTHCSVSTTILFLAASVTLVSPKVGGSNANGDEAGGKVAGGSFVIGPDYTIDPDLTDKGNPKGRSFEFSMRLKDSEIFRGDDATLSPQKKIRAERKIFVYVPAAYQDGTKATVLVMHDGPSNLHLVRGSITRA